MPYVDVKVKSDNEYHLSLKKLLSFEYEEFRKHLDLLKKQNIAEVIIDNDFKDIENPILEETIECYKLSLLYHYQKNGFLIYKS